MAVSITLIPACTAAIIAAVYPASLSSLGWPRYVPIPSDETTRSWASRKCPSPATPRNFSAYALVPSFVAPPLISVPHFCFVLGQFLFPVFLLSSSPAVVSTPAESSGAANPFHGKRSRRRAAGCRTIVPPATSGRSNRWYFAVCSPPSVARRSSLLPNIPALFLLPSAAR